MPAQVPTVGRAYYQQGDTAPNLRRQLLKGDGTPIDLSGCNVFIDVAYGSYDYYYSPQRKLVDEGPCIVETPETDGFVQWQPLPGDLDTPGAHQFRFKIVFGDGRVQHVPPHTYETIIVSTPVGGVDP